MEIQEEVQKELTFGEKAVGVTFNPSNNPRVDEVKAQFTSIIDDIQNDFSKKTDSGKFIANWMLNVLRTSAITACITAQMTIVKFITWND